MKELFVPYEIARLAIEKGFAEKCLAYWKSDKSLDIAIVISKDELTKNSSVFGVGCIIAPSYQQIIDWFREKHKIFIQIEPNVDFSIYIYDIYMTPERAEKTQFYGERWVEYNNYYDALDKAIEEAFTYLN